MHVLTHFAVPLISQASSLISHTFVENKYRKIQATSY